VTKKKMAKKYKDREDPFKEKAIDTSEVLDTKRQA
jgi:hypothetical protein